jgi:UDP-glucose 4-epimerase
MAERPTVLVTGGAGYIGAHAVLSLRAAGRRVVVLDNLSTGVREAVPGDVTLVEGDVGDTKLLARLFAEREIGAVMHFAGSIVVPDSVTDPLGYYHNNTVKSHGLIRAAVSAGFGPGRGAFLFSSTAAVYGTPETLPIAEEAPTVPINPYGSSKLMTETMLRDAGAAHGLAHGILRYFNVAGADPEGRVGQSTPAATHLIKVACQAVLGARPRLEIYGEDFPTPDGTGVRDYIHVSDLARAHVLALEKLESGTPSLLLNCGYGHGASVREVIAAVERAAGRKVPVATAPRRPGDPAALYARAERIRAELGWKPAHDDLDEIVRSALAWEERLVKRIPRSSTAR